MSLTERASADPLWRGLPTLRKLLGAEDLPWEGYGASSVSPNVFSDTQELLTVALLSLHRSEAMNAGNSMSNQRVSALTASARDTSTGIVIRKAGRANSDSEHA